MRKAWAFKKVGNLTSFYISDADMMTAKNGPICLTRS